MKRTGKLFIIVLILHCILFVSKASSLKSITDLVIRIDTLQFRYNTHFINLQGDSYLPFLYQNESETCEIHVFPKSATSQIKLLPSPDYEILDSLVFINQQYFRLKVRFVNLNKSHFLNFTFQIKNQESENVVIEEVRLLPFTQTFVKFYPSNDELYIGEEKVFELVSNNIGNIKLSGDWTTGNDINYRISERNGQLRIHLLPTSLGNRVLNLKVYTKSPYVDENKKLIYECPIFTQMFKVKASRMAFLNLDKRELTYDEMIRTQGVEVTLDNGKNMQLQKTYRIENQEQPGGTLIAELFTKNYLANDKVLCLFRAYNLHRQTEGYLYIKDGDEAKFITNVSITPKTTINSVETMRGGADWTSNSTVYPGETVDVRIQGEGLHKGRFFWEDVNNLTPDTLTRSENVSYFKLQIPISISKRKIYLFNNSTSTGIALNVREYQVPRQFDFVYVNFGNGRQKVQNLSPTIIERKTIPDIIFSFDNSKIDTDNKLFGKQYLDLDIKIIGKRGELIEMKTIKNVLICPTDNSIRAPYYKDRNCNNMDISLNNILSNKTYNIDDFSKVQVEVVNTSDKYSEPTYSKKFEIVVQHPVAFDIDVSFPAGLLVQNLGRTESEQEKLDKYGREFELYTAEKNAYLEALDNWKLNPSGDPPPSFTKTEPVKPEKAAFTDNIGGISLALIAQFSFPDGKKVGKLKPYRLGAGFLAINAFNFSETAKRDLAAVALASLYPIKPGKIFNLPIHFGFGYKFQDKIPFVMLSPGIGIRF